jgi:hypothetical protein
VYVLTFEEEEEEERGGGDDTQCQLGNLQKTGDGHSGADHFTSTTGHQHPVRAGVLEWAAGCAR